MRLLLVITTFYIILHTIGACTVQQTRPLPIDNDLIRLHINTTRGGV